MSDRMSEMQSIAEEFKALQAKAKSLNFQLDSWSCCGWKDGVELYDLDPTSRLEPIQLIRNEG